MKIDSAALKTAYAILNHVPKTGTQESSQFVHIAQRGERLYLSLTGTVFAEGKVAASDIPKDFEAWVDRRVMETLSSFSSGDVTINVAPDDGPITAKTGRQTVQIARHAPVAGYTQWTAGKKARTITLSPELRETIAFLAEFTPGGNESLDLRLRGVQLEQGFGVFATDAVSLAAVLAIGTDPWPSESATIPAVIARLLPQLGGDLTLESYGLAIVSKEGLLGQSIDTELENFPTDTVKEYLAKALKSKTKFRVAVAPLAEGLEYLNRYAFADSKEPRVQLSGKAGGKYVIARLESGGLKAEYRIAAEVEFDLEETWRFNLGKIRVWADKVARVDPKMIVSAAIPLRASKGESTPMASFRVKQEGFQHVLALVDSSDAE